MLSLPNRMLRASLNDILRIALLNKSRDSGAALSAPLFNVSFILLPKPLKFEKSPKEIAWAEPAVADGFER